MCGLMLSPEIETCLSESQGLQIRRLHVVIVVRLDPLQYPGGAEINALKFGKWLSKDMRVSLVTSGRGSAFFGRSFSIHRVPSIRLKMLECASFALTATLAILRLKPTLVHLQTAELGNCLIAISSKMLRIPVLLCVMGSDVNLFERRHPLDRLVAKIAFNISDVVLCLTRDLGSKTRKIQPRTRVIVLPTGIEMQSNGAPPTNPEQSIDLCLKSQIQDRKIILYVGSIRRIKGLQYLVGAFAQVHKKIASAVLVVVGEGDDKRRIERFVDQLALRDDVVFVGNVPHNRVPAYFAIADVFVLPSLAEGLPTVILEAYRAGVPVIATRVCGNSELVEDGVTGFLVAPGNEKDLADKIERLLLDMDLAQSMATASSAEAQRYSMQKIVKRLERIYLFMLGAGSRPGEWST
jgi:glycosyltransferase involved in cell wall biosynthesis